MYGGRFVPRRLFGHEGVGLEETGQQYDLEPWTETEKLGGVFKPQKMDDLKPN